MSENLKRHRPDIKVLGEGKAIAFMPEDPMGVWVHIQDVRDLLDVKDRTIRDYEDNYIPRPKTMELKSWMIGSPETGEQWVYDAEEADRVIAGKDAEIAELKDHNENYRFDNKNMLHKIMKQDSEIRRLQRALYVARAERALEKIAWFKLWNASISTMNPEDGDRQEFDKWKKALGKFLKKAEEYL